MTNNSSSQFIAIKLATSFHLQIYKRSLMYKLDHFSANRLDKIFPMSNNEHDDMTGLVSNTNSLFSKPCGDLLCCAVLGLRYNKVDVEDEEELDDHEDDKHIGTK